MAFSSFDGPQTIKLRKETGDDAPERDPDTGDWEPGSPNAPGSDIVLPSADIQFGPMKEETFGTVGSGDVEAGQAILFATDPAEDPDSDSTAIIEVGDAIIMDDGLREMEYEVIELTASYDWLEQELGSDAGGKEWLVERRGDL